MEKKIVHLTSAHQSDDTRIFHKECKTLNDAGYEVVLISQHPRNEVIDGVQIRGIPKPKNRIQRMIWTTIQVYSAAVKENAAVYHFHDPELILIGLLLKMRRKKVVYDLHEDVPRQIMSKYWIPKIFRGILSRLVEDLETFAVRKIDYAVCATNKIAKRFPLNKRVEVLNFPLLDEYRTEQVPYAKREAIIAHPGGLTPFQGIWQMVDAMVQIPDYFNAKLVLAGEFMPPELQYTISTQPGWIKTDYLGWIDRQGVVELLNRAKIGIMIDQHIPNYLEGISTKLFEYMLAGIPVVSTDLPLTKEFVNAVQCGLVVNPLDIEAIAKAIIWLLEHPVEAEEMGKRGRIAVLQTYNWEREAQKLLRLYERLINSDSVY